VEPHEVDTIIRHLAAAIAEQGAINEDLRACVREQRQFNAQQVEINQDVKSTLARIETLRARMMPQSDNGRDA
jgi:predicted  nucleic acid-binding Zn-ribbon protein